MTIQITTEEYWDVDGVPLNTYAYNISTLSGRTSTAPLRGQDQEQAYRPGKRFRPKVADSRTISLAMWVQGSDPESMGSGSTNHSAQFKTNLRMLQKLFFTPRRQIVLTKRWRDLDGLHTASALGQVVDSIDPGHTANRAAFVVDVFLADPFFYDTTLTVVPVGIGAPGSTTNPGDAATPNNLLVTFTGPLTNPILTNTTPNPDISLSYAGSLADGVSLIVDVPSARAVTANTLVNDKISYSGSIWPMEVFDGLNNFTLTASAGSGSAVVSYRAAYL